MDTPAAAVTPAQGGRNASVWDSLYPAQNMSSLFLEFFFVLSFLIVVTKAVGSKTGNRGGLEPLYMLVIFPEALLQVENTVRSK